jgi:hypothetical protein
VVDGACHVGQQIRVTKAHAADQQSDLGTGGDLSPRRQRRPAFKVIDVGLIRFLLRLAVDDADERLVEVVVSEDRIHAEVLGLQHGVAPGSLARRTPGLWLHPDMDSVLRHARGFGRGGGVLVGCHVVVADRGCGPGRHPASLTLAVTFVLSLMQVPIF